MVNEKMTRCTHTAFVRVEEVVNLLSGDVQHRVLIEMHVYRCVIEKQE